MRLAHLDAQREWMDRRHLGHSKTAFFKVEFLDEVEKNQCFLFPQVA